MFSDPPSGAKLEYVPGLEIHVTAFAGNGTILTGSDIFNENRSSQTRSRANHNRRRFSTVLPGQLSSRRKPHEGLRAVCQKNFQSESHRFKIIQESQFLHGDGVKHLPCGKPPSQVRDSSFVAFGPHRTRKVDARLPYGRRQIPSLFLQELAQQSREVLDSSASESLMADGL